MVNKISYNDAEHYTWGGCCNAGHLVNQPHMSVIEELIPAGSQEQMHAHKKASQFFYVLTGTLRMVVGDTAVVLRPNEGLEVGPGIQHQVFNDGPDVVRMLLFSTPNAHGDRIGDGLR